MRLIFPILVLVAGCLWITYPLWHHPALFPDFKTGTVVDKEYRGPWTQMVWNGKSMFPIIHPAKWVLLVRGKCSDGFDRDRTYRVSKAEFDDFEIGETYP